MISCPQSIGRWSIRIVQQGTVQYFGLVVLLGLRHYYWFETAAEVTGAVLHAVFSALHDQRVWLGRMLLKPNMVVAGKDWPYPASVQEVATATLRSLRHHVPAAVPGIVFCRAARTIGRLRSWKISFSYGRALQEHALETWHGRQENLAAGRQALRRRARCNSAASLGRYLV